MLETAKYYADKYGFAVMPVHGINPITKKCTCGKEQCNTPDHRGKVQAGKHPWTINGLKNASSNIDAIETLWNLKKHSNIGIVTGPISGIFVLDIDGPQGESSLQLYGALPETLTSFTGNGRHLVFKYPSKKVYTRAGKFAPGLDIRGEGAFQKGMSKKESAFLAKNNGLKIIKKLNLQGKEIGTKIIKKQN